MGKYRYIKDEEMDIIAETILKDAGIFNINCNEPKLIVIPTISWSTKKSYEFCFSGVEKGSVVAVSTLGNRMDKRQYLKGYNKMLEVINPSTIYCYDRPFKEMEGDIVYIDYLKSNGRKGYRL